MARRLLAALTMFLLGCGVMALLVGLLGDRYSWQTGVIGMVGFWVVALSLAAFLAAGGRYR
jgi:MFS family permease